MTYIWVSSNFGPDSIYVVVESLQSKNLQLRLLIGEEGENAGRRDDTRHLEGLRKIGGEER
jgi:hypothetical protein